LGVGGCVVRGDRGHLAADGEENVVVVYVGVVLEGQQARFGVGPVALVHGKIVTTSVNGLRRRRPHMSQRRNIISPSYASLHTLLSSSRAMRDL